MLSINKLDQSEGQTMGHRFAELMFSAEAKAIQTEQGSRRTYEKMEARENYNHLLTEKEASFLAQRDSFYMASVSPDGWPYIQHRGGPKGFLKVLDEKHIGFADFRGNRQYISTANLRQNDRVSLFLMDYANRRRLKMLGHARELGENDPLLSRLEDKGYNATVERGFIIEVAAFDWNCPQHITPRYDEAAIKSLVSPLVEELTQLKEAHDAGEKQ